MIGRSLDIVLILSQSLYESKTLRLIFVTFLCCFGMRWKEKGASIILILRDLVLTSIKYLSMANYESSDRAILKINPKL
jgi:hypothetical protein